MSTDFKVRLLQAFGAKGQTLDELLQYCNHSFEDPGAEGITIGEAPHIKAYEDYVKEAEAHGAFETISQHLVQLQLPVEKGMSQTEIYKNVVLRGKSNTNKTKLQLKAPNLIELQVYTDDLIGKVPVMLIPDKSDFDTIVCALTNKSEPKVIPASTGAAFIKGLNNWSRIHELKNAWMSEHPFGSWNQEFRQNILPYPELYQDQLILLSKNPYSHVSAEKLDLDDELWSTYSVAIRRAHECAHLFTLRHYGKMENHIFDELVADYAGITAALDHYELSWFLHFMGLEDSNTYREGGRFQNYLPGLSKNSSKTLQKILVQAANNISKFDSAIRNSGNDLNRRKIIKTICETGFLPLASDQGSKLLLEKYGSSELALK